MTPTLTDEKPALLTPSTLRKAPARTLPAWCPAWARELAESYFSGTTCFFVLHGNVHDLIRCRRPGRPYCSLAEFLTTQIFGRWDLVLGYDLSQGLRPHAGHDADRLRAMQQQLAARWGEPGNWPRDADAVLVLLDGLIERNLIDPAARKSVAMLFPYAEYLSPPAISIRWPAARPGGWSASSAGPRAR